jgi:hypothetical protein
MPRRAGVTAIADAARVSRGRASALLKAAGMRKGRDGKFVYDKAVETILASLDPARSIGHVAGGDDTALDDATADRIGALQSAKARYEVLRAQKLEQEIAARAGRLIDRTAVVALAKHVGAHIRDNVLAVAPKVAADCQGKDAEAIQRILANALRDALLTLTEDGAFLLPAAT